MCRLPKKLIFVGAIALILFGAIRSAPTNADSLAANGDSASSERSRAKSPFVYLLSLDEAIGAMTYKRVNEAIEAAEEDSAEALIIEMDTPGGLTVSTWAIDKAILNSHVPVIVYIAPAGARAGSAGVFITYSAHFAVMAPGTNIGAAHPVGGGGEKIDSTMNEKVTNDAVAAIRAMAEKRGRNADWAEKAVRQSVAITDREALELNVINARAESRAEVYRSLDSKVAETPAGARVMHLVGAREVELEISFIERVLRYVASPDIVFLLLSIGGLGIILELYNPGAIFPGVVGGIALILAFFGLQQLPVNTTGILLIAFALILFIAEIKVISYGILSLGGVISLALGGMFLIDSYDPELSVSVTMLWAVVLGVALTLGSAIVLVMRSSRRKVATGAEGMIGLIGEARTDLSPSGMVFVAGELWKATSAERLGAGAEIVVERVEGIHLVVRKK